MQWAGIGLCQCRGNLILRNAAECELASGDKKKKSWFMNIWYLAPGSRMMETVTRDMWGEWGTGIMCPVSRLWWHLHDDNDCMMHHVWKCGVYTVHWPPLGMCGARCWASDVSWHLVTSPPLLLTAECPPLVTLCPSALSPGPGQLRCERDWECDSLARENKLWTCWSLCSRVNIIIIWCFDRLPRPVICQARCSGMGTHEHLS